MKTIYVAGAVVIAAVAVWYLWPKGGQDGMQGMGGQPEVSVVTMRSEEVVLTKDLPGRTSAVRVAEIRPQVNGVILKRMFEEGGIVKQGQQLYQIDPAPYQASYNSALADLKKAEANVISVTSKTERYTELVKIGGVSKQEFDDVTASLAQARADVAIARAALATAKINLDYTKVMSPIAGRIGQSTVTEGALVTANQADALAMVQQLDHVYVDVSQSGEEALKLRKQYMAQASSVSPSVQLIVDGAVMEKDGELQFSDVSVNPTTGTVLIRALFPNEDLSILPGMFVHARLEQWRDESALLVPQQSVSLDAQGGVTVWVVTPENKAVVRPISVTEVVGDKWLVSKGLKTGEKVILEGTMKVQPDMVVTAVEHGVSGTAPAQGAAPVAAE